MSQDNLLTDPLWTIKSMREINIRFDLVENEASRFILKKSGAISATVEKSSLSDRDLSILTSLSEFDISK